MKIQIHHSTTRKQTRNRAFTLVELMLVVTIIGILAALVIPSLVGRTEQARVTSAIADVTGGMATALNLYEVDSGVFPKSLQDLSRNPRTPETGTDRI